MTDKHDKLAEMARECGGQQLHGVSKCIALSRSELAAFRSAILADAAKDVQVVAWGIFANNGNIRFWACDKASADLQAAKTGGDVVGIVPATTLAAAQALNAELLARVAELGVALRTADRTFAENGILASHAARQEIQSALTKGQP